MLGVQVVAWSVATRGDRTQLEAAASAPRGPVAHALRGLLCAIVGRKASGLREGCVVAGDDPRVVGPAIVLGDKELHRLRHAHVMCGAREPTGGSGLRWCGAHG